MPVLSLVTARIPPERQPEVGNPHREALDAGLPPGIRQTFLLVGEDDAVSIATV